MIASERLGIPVRNDFNDPTAPPYVCTQVEVTLDEHGRRVSTFDAFLPKEIAIQRQNNLYICVGSVVSKIDIRSEAGALRAAGVFLQHDTMFSSEATHPQYYARARREVILCSGAIVSPQVLLLRCGIPVCPAFVALTRDSAVSDLQSILLRTTSLS